MMSVMRNSSGSLTAELHVSGDYDSPALHDVDIRLQRESEVDIRITGQVSDIMTGRGLDLRIDGQSSDPKVLSWLLFERDDQIESFSLSGHVVEDSGRFLMRDVDARARSRPGLETHLTGTTRIPTRKDPRPAGSRFPGRDSSTRRLGGASLRMTGRAH